MNHLKLILTFLIVFLFSGITMAYNTTSSNGNENGVKEEVPGPKANSQKPRVQKANAEVLDSPTEHTKKDSSNINSVNKFNYVFYFIYKLKYDSEPTGNEYLDFQF